MAHIEATKPYWEIYVLDVLGITLLSVSLLADLAVIGFAASKKRYATVAERLPFYIAIVDVVKSLGGAYETTSITDLGGLTGCIVSSYLFIISGIIITYLAAFVCTTIYINIFGFRQISTDSAKFDVYLWSFSLSNGLAPIALGIPLKLFGPSSYFCGFWIANYTSIRAIPWIVPSYITLMFASIMFCLLLILRKLHVVDRSWNRQHNSNLPTRLDGNGGRGGGGGHRSYVGASMTVNNPSTKSGRLSRHPSVSGRYSGPGVGGARSIECSTTSIVNIVASSVEATSPIDTVTPSITTSHAHNHVHSNDPRLTSLTSGSSSTSFDATETQRSYSSKSFKMVLRRGSASGESGTSGKFTSRSIEQERSRRTTRWLLMYVVIAIAGYIPNAVYLFSIAITGE
ncbi:hypothetical protein HK102_002801 [Quaeritorhiza haematococci]|nr:hypothetical protein HK102_002801 [Quaeritorhiza haematococci]